MNSPEETQATQSTAAETEKSFFGIIIHSFFVVPFLIAVFAVLLFVAVRLLTSEQHTIYDYLNDVKTGSLTKRWQSAFELSKLVANPERIPKERRFAAELTSAFRQSMHDDNRVRQYLALAMGRTGNAAFAAPLEEALTTDKEDNLYAIIYALGMIREKKSAEKIVSFVNDPQSRIRLVSVMALGNIGNPDSKMYLKQSLSDTEPNIQWDAAIALAKMGDASGREILLKLLDRSYLSKFPEVDVQEQTHVVLVAIEAAKNLADPELNQAIKQLARADQNMNVRQAAMAVNLN